MKSTKTKDHVYQFQFSFQTWIINCSSCVNRLIGTDHWSAGTSEEELVWAWTRWKRTNFSWINYPTSWCNLNSEEESIESRAESIDTKKPWAKLSNTPVCKGKGNAKEILVRETTLHNLEPNPSLRVCLGVLWTPLHLLNKHWYGIERDEQQPISLNQSPDNLTQPDLRRQRCRISCGLKSRKRAWFTRASRSIQHQHQPNLIYEHCNLEPKGTAEKSKK
jgi:hypothetical protein